METASRLFYAIAIWVMEVVSLLDARQIIKDLVTFLATLYIIRIVLQLLKYRRWVMSLFQTGRRTWAWDQDMRRITRDRRKNLRFLLFFVFSDQGRQRLHGLRHLVRQQHCRLFDQLTSSQLSNDRQQLEAKLLRVEQQLGLLNSIDALAGLTAKWRSVWRLVVGLNRRSRKASLTKKEQSQSSE